MNNNPATVNRVLNIVFSEIDTLKKRYISQKELARAKNNFKVDFYKQFSSTLEEAIFLANQEIDKKSVNSVKEEFQRYMQVTNLDLMKIINRYFLAKNRVILKVIPK